MIGYTKVQRKMVSKVVAALIYRSNDISTYRGLTRSGSMARTLTQEEGDLIGEKAV